MTMIFINCSIFPFLWAIMTGKKLYETRTRNTLKNYIGKRIMLCQTGKGKKLVMCFATIESVLCITDPVTWKRYRKQCYIKKGSTYDYVPGTKKYLYKLTNIEIIKPFVPKEGKRHGRIGMDYNGREE